MDVSIGAEVHCSEGSCGRLTRVIVNPSSEAMTHLVVKEGTLGTDHTVPIDAVRQSTPTSILLDCSRRQLEQFPPFTVADFNEPLTAYNNALAAQYLFWPYAGPIFGGLVLAHEKIPPGEVAVRRSTPVQATDGYIGRVREFLVVVPGGQISHLVLEEGLLWNKKEVTIPISQLDRIQNDTVYLKLDKTRIAALPAIPIRRALRAQQKSE